MKKISVFGLLVIFLANSASVSAIDVVLSRNNLRLNNTATSTSFTATLSDDIEALTGSGFIPAKLKIKSKDVTSTTKTIMIPYTDGVIGTSDEVTLTLTSTLIKSSESPVSITLPGKYKKKYSINKLTKTLSLDADAIQLSGRVTIPSGDLSSFRARTVKKLAKRRERGVAPFNTENPEGVVVELFEVNPDTGETVGEPLADAITDADGNYEMEMPPEADFGPGFALVVEGDNEEAMHAPVYSGDVDLNPATEALFELTQDVIADPTVVGLPANEEISFDNFNETELEGLNDKFEELNPVYEDTLDASVVSLKDSYSTFLNNMLGFAADDDSVSEETDLSTVVKDIAGDYYVTFFDGSMATENRVGVSVELAGARMTKPDEVGALTVIPFPSFSTQASMFVAQSRGNGGDHPDDGQCEGPDCGGDHPDDGQCEGPGCGGDNPDNGQCEGPDCGGDNPNDSGSGDQGSSGGEGAESNDKGCFEVEASVEAARGVNGTDDSGNFYMTVDSNKVISFAEPASEEIHSNPDGDYIYRSLPSVMHMIPVGDDMFLSASTYVGALIDPQGETVFDYDAGFGSIIKKSKLTAADLTGDYGMVGLGFEVGVSSFSVSSMFGSLSFSGTSVVNFSTADSYREAFISSCESESYSVNSGDKEAEGTASLEFSGDRVSILVDDDDPSSETLFTGFARSDAEILTLVYASDRGAQGSKIDFGGKKRNVVTNADRKMIFAVKKPKTMLSLNGKSYRILSLNSSVNTSGGRVLESGDTGTLSFTSSTASVAGFTKSLYTKATASSAVVESSATVAEADLAYTLASDGAISMTVAGEEWVGFVSSDKSLIVFNVDEDDGLGIYLAILQE